MWRCPAPTDNPIAAPAYGGFGGAPHDSMAMAMVTVMAATRMAAARLIDAAHRLP